MKTPDVNQVLAKHMSLNVKAQEWIAKGTRYRDEGKPGEAWRALKMAEAYHERAEAVLKRWRATRPD